MSHFTTLSTHMTELEMVKKALSDLKYVQKTGTVHGYMGNTIQAPIVINTGVSGYDIGFIQKHDHIDVIADWYGLKNINQQQFVNSITQRYAYHVTKDQLEKEGFTLVEEAVEQDNTIRISVRRMAA